MTPNNQRRQQQRMKDFWHREIEDTVISYYNTQEMLASNPYRGPRVPYKPPELTVRIIRDVLTYTKYNIPERYKPYLRERLEAHRRQLIAKAVAERLKARP